MIPILMKQPERPNDKVHKVRQISSAACPKELWLAFQERFGVKLSEGYGATDGGGFMLTTGGSQDVPPGTMGKPLPGMVGEILNDDGTIFTEPDKVGELVFLVREKEIESRKVKYYKDEESSQRLISEAKDGQKWFHTGD